MSSGFNTDIEVGGRVFHVQTEDRGPEYFVIDTAVYHNGQVLYRHSRSYEHFAKSAEFNRQDSARTRGRTAPLRDRRSAVGRAGCGNCGGSPESGAIRGNSSPIGEYEVVAIVGRGVAGARDGAPGRSGARTGCGSGSHHRRRGTGRELLRAQRRLRSRWCCASRCQALGKMI